LHILLPAAVGVLSTASEFSDLVLAVLGLAAKLERRRILERTARGRAEAMAKGVRFGRERKLSPQKRKQVVALQLAGEAKIAIARLLNVSYSTIARKKDGIGPGPTALARFLAGPKGSTKPSPDFGPLDIRYYWCPYTPGVVDKTNDLSLVVLVRYGAFCIAFNAHIDQCVAATLLARAFDPGAEVASALG
jgi:hypothetical protein